MHELRIGYDGSGIRLGYSLPGGVGASEFLPVDKTMDVSFLNYRLLETASPFFYQHLPVEHLEIVLEESLQGGGAFVMAAAEFVGHLLKNTNHFIQRYPDLKGCAAAHDRVLYYRLDGDERFTDLFENARRVHPDRVLLLDGKTGYDSVERKWKEASHVDADQLIRFIQENRIGRIVSTNMYYLEWFLRQQQLHFLAILRFLGVEYIIYDVDYYDQVVSGYLEKAALNCKEFRRLSIYPHMQQPWDQLFGLTNVSYALLYRSPSPSPRVPVLEEDYSILVLSHSRLDYLQALVDPLLFSMKEAREETVFHEFRLWYFALREMVIASPWPVGLKLDATVKLYNIYLAGLALFKLEMIHAAGRIRNVRIFGDPGWARVFPEYYQQRYLNLSEKEELLRDGRHLYLLLNENYSYLECHPVIQDALHRHVAFLTFSPIVRIPGLEGLKAIEYSSASELALRLETIHADMESEGLRTSLSVLRKLWISCGEDLIGGLMGPARPIRVFQDLCGEGSADFHHQLENYITERRAWIEESFAVLFLQEKTHFTRQGSLFMSRPYLQRLLSAAEPSC